MAFKKENSDTAEISMEEGHLKLSDMLHCDPCSEDGNHLQAEGYCVDCEEYLCSICFQHHLRPKPCKSHLLLDKHHMPVVNSSPKTYKDECTEPCGAHKDKIIEYFCKDCNIIGCSVCMTLGHRDCFVVYITDFANRFLRLSEYRSYKASLKTFINHVQHYHDLAMENFNNTKTNADEAMGEVKKFRQEIDRFFDELEIIISDRILQNQRENQQSMQAELDMYVKLEKDVEKMCKDIENKEMTDQTCRLFIDLKRWPKSIHSHQKIFRKLMEKKKKQFKVNAFIPSKGIFELIHDSKQQFGSLIDRVIYSDHMGYIYFRKIATLSNGGIVEIHQHIGRKPKRTTKVSKPNRVYKYGDGRSVTSKLRKAKDNGITATSAKERTNMSKSTKPKTYGITAISDKGSTTMFKPMSISEYGIMTISDDEIAVAHRGTAEISMEEGHLKLSDMLHCDPCSEDGNHLQAEGYCVDCEEYLCSICFQHHLRPKPCKSHLLLDKHHMPVVKSSPKTYKDECTEPCGAHKDKIIEYFCKDCNIIGCSVCMTLGHRDCFVVYITDFANRFLRFSEYRSYKASLKTFIGHVKFMHNLATENFNKIKTKADKAMGEVKKFRQEIDRFFDELEIIISDKILQNQRENQQSMQADLDMYVKLEKDVEKMCKDIENKEMTNQTCRLFIDLKRRPKSIHSHQNIFRKLREKKKQLKVNAFIRSKGIVELIHDSKQQFGSLISLDRVINSHFKGYFREIATLSNGRIVVTYENIERIPKGTKVSKPNMMCKWGDGRSFTSKLRKAKDNGITATSAKERTNMSKSTKPKTYGITAISDKGSTTMFKPMSISEYGIVAISDDEIAVAHRGDIEIYSVSDEITLKKTIHIAGLKRTLIYTDNKFICTLGSPYFVQMVNLEGKVVKRYPIELNGEKLFKNPWNMAINKDHTLIYVSDWGMETVTCLSIEGQVKSRYKHKSTWNPKAIAVSDDGLVYVNDYFNNVIHILTADLKEMSVIDVKRYGIYNPEGLAFCQRERKLFVGMNSTIVVLNIEL